METISERLRRRHEPLMDGKSTWRKIPVCQEGADVIDALVAALEAMRKEFREADLPYGSSAYLQSGAALAMARKGG